MSNFDSLRWLGPHKSYEKKFTLTNGTLTEEGERIHSTSRGIRDVLPCKGTVEFRADDVT